MTHPVTRKEFAAAMALAVATLCLGFYLSIAVGRDDVGTLLMRIFGLIACGIVIKYTFALGRVRGFPVGQANGTIHTGNLLRNLVASVIALACFVWLSGPFMMAIAAAARR